MWSYPVALHAKNSANTCKRKENWPRAGEGEKYDMKRVGEEKETGQRDGRKKRKKFFPRVLFCSWLILESNTTQSSMTKDPRGLRPTLSFLFLSTNNLVFEPPLSHPIRLAFVCSSVLPLSMRTYTSKSPRFLTPQSHLALIITCVQEKKKRWYSFGVRYTWILILALCNSQQDLTSLSLNVLFCNIGIWIGTLCGLEIICEKPLALCIRHIPGKKEPT